MKIEKFEKIAFRLADARRTIAVQLSRCDCGFFLLPVCEIHSRLIHIRLILSVFDIHAHAFI
jgi:hypothetical protein